MTNLLEKEKISADELIRELQFLLNDYFVGNFAQEPESICLTFRNGQRFRLTVEEVR